MPEYVERLVRCGINLIDAYEICDDYMYDGDYDGLEYYVELVERDQLTRNGYVG